MVCAGTLALALFSRLSRCALEAALGLVSSAAVCVRGRRWREAIHGRAESTRLLFRLRHGRVRELHRFCSGKAQGTSRREEGMVCNSGDETRKAWGRRYPESVGCCPCATCAPARWISRALAAAAHRRDPVRPRRAVPRSPARARASFPAQRLFLLTRDFSMGRLVELSLFLCIAPRGNPAPSFSG
ncbi:hypothetical protein DFH09DRAFT_115721 [Mycena vulgaris]|nr:hypothetical protein DFH09DRAFT_115721 [Mycena vulgaris]